MKPSSGKKRPLMAKRGIEKTEEQIEDLSLISHSLDVVRGAKDLMQALKEGTEQFKDLVYNECSLIYECKICRNLFRSVANFLSHKRKFCLTRSFHPGPKENEAIPCKRSRSTSSSPLPSPRRQVMPIPSQPLSQTILSMRTTIPPSAALHQKSESERRVSEAGIVVLSEDGAVMGQHPCLSCKAAFTTSDQLSDHVVLYHRIRTCFSCPLCKLLLATPHSVYRHLGKIHGRTEKQIRRLRPSVLGKTVKSELFQNGARSEALEHPMKTQGKRASDDSLHCNVCGKNFTRKAVLHAHSNICKPPVPKPGIQEANNCQQCGVEFARRAVLLAHSANCKGRLPSPIKAHPCRFCGRRFALRRVMTAHIPRCPRRIVSSPVRYLMSPPKVVSGNTSRSPSIIQVRCDYNKTPSPVKSDGVLARPLSRLESVVSSLKMTTAVEEKKCPNASALNSVSRVLLASFITDKIGEVIQIPDFPPSQSSLTPPSLVTCVPPATVTPALPATKPSSPSSCSHGKDSLSPSPIDIDSESQRVIVTEQEIHEMDGSDESEKSPVPVPAPIACNIRNWLPEKLTDLPEVSSPAPVMCDVAIPASKCESQFPSMPTMTNGGSETVVPEHSPLDSDSANIVVHTACSPVLSGVQVVASQHSPRDSDSANIAVLPDCSTELSDVQISSDSELEEGEIPSDNTNDDEIVILYDNIEENLNKNKKPNLLSIIDDRSEGGRIRARLIRRASQDESDSMPPWRETTRLERVFDVPSLAPHVAVASCERDPTSGIGSTAPPVLPGPVTCGSCYDSGVSDDGCLSEAADLSLCPSFLGFDPDEVDRSQCLRIDSLVNTWNFQLEIMEGRVRKIAPSKLTS